MFVYIFNLNKRTNTNKKFSCDTVKVNLLPVKGPNGILSVIETL